MTERADGAAAAKPRIPWIDVVKALSILWIAFFHGFETWADGRFPSPLEPDYLGRFLADCAPVSAAGTLSCVGRAAFVGFGQLGFHAVSVFLVMSGFGLAWSAAGRERVDPRDWFRSRFLRLYPMYWVAHAIVIFAPFAFRPEPVDWRVVPSLLGLRFWPPIESNFYYLDPAWWYFGVLIQLYLVFLPLYAALRRLGPAAFLALCAAATFAARAALLVVWPVNGLWVQGGFFGCRLVEFAGGMALAYAYRRDRAAVEAWLFSPASLVAGAAVYGLALVSGRSLGGYVFTDALVALGLFPLLAHAARGLGALPRAGTALASVGLLSYGLYLLHQPFVIPAAIALRSRAMPVFTLVMVPFLAAFTLASMRLERFVDGWAGRILGGSLRRNAAAPAVGAPRSE
ncbi:MAG TPA: acyltransferase [Myxococcota bacterium]|nr:acyltransferase [Myxococcota bacterium]